MRRGCSVCSHPDQRGNYETGHLGLTIGVANLEHSLAFYARVLGLPTEGIVGQEFEYCAVAFFTLSGGLRLAIWAQDDSVHDTGLSKARSVQTSLTIGPKVANRGEVVMDEARRAGAEITRPAGDTFYGGYAGYFRDPARHGWEVVSNPSSHPKESLE